MQCRFCEPRVKKTRSTAGMSEGLKIWEGGGSINVADPYFVSQIIGTLYFKVAWCTLLPNSLCSLTRSTL